MRLLAQKQITLSVGSVEKGMIFDAGPDVADGLIASGHAVVVHPDLDRALTQLEPVVGQDPLAVFIMASGPSLTHSDAELVHQWKMAKPNRRIVIVINTTFRMAPWADHLYASDGGWWDVYAEEALRTFPGQKWCHGMPSCKKYGLNHIQLERKPGLSRHKGVIYSGGNSGYQSIGLAYNLGARRIGLLGYDMMAMNGKQHWHGEHPKPLFRTCPFPSWIRRFADLSRDLRLERLEVYNCSRATAMNCFTRRSLEQVLEEWNG